VALTKKVETRNMVLSIVGERRIEHQLQRLEQRLTHYPEPTATVVLTSHAAQRLTQVDLRVQLGPAGPHLISHQAAETADHAIALAIDDVLRQQERHRSALLHEPSYGVPSRREAREHRHQPVAASSDHEQVQAPAPADVAAADCVHEPDVSITIDPPALHAATHPRSLAGTLDVPEGASGLVVFAHGSGSSRRSPRNRRVARILQDAGFATLLLDLLTAEEEAEDALTGHLRFDIDLLAKRLAGAATWLRVNPVTRGLPLGYFGASTGAGAALVAAAAHPELVGAVVSRGGRPDLAGSALEQVKTPTLLIVGGDDLQVITLNQEALARLKEPKRMEIVPGATHLFEEPGALDRVAELARDWFAHYLTPVGTSRA